MSTTIVDIIDITVVCQAEKWPGRVPGIATSLRSRQMPRPKGYSLIARKAATIMAE